MPHHHAVHELFRHCPRCGVPREGSSLPNRFACGSCRFEYYFGSALAAAVFIQRDDGRVLFIRRAREPGLGRLAPPGGFIDPGEPAEVAARREVREEVGIDLADLRFLCSQPNRYGYGDVDYPVLDLFFVARTTEPDRVRALEDVAGVEWLDAMTMNPAELAFPSMSAALEFWQGERGPTPA